MVYISGKITGNPDYKKQFDEAERLLKSMGYKCFNPTSIYHEHWSYGEYMKADIAHLVNCDYIYRLDNWEDSRGARLENKIAEVCGIVILEVFKVKK